MKRPFAILLSAACMALAAHAQVPCRWTVDLARVTPADWDCLRGETVELMPSFVSGRDVRDLSGVESATLWWQTNGMGAAYWSAPASVDTNSRPHRLVARWTPEMDCGAASYRYFVGAAAPSGTQYRAHGTIRMRGAPGAEPNTLPLPVQVLDFARIAVTNAPWGEVRAESDPVFGQWRESYGVALGTGATIGNHAGYGVAIGAYAGADMYGTAVGSEDEDGNAAYAYGSGTVQLGPGTNTDNGTLNFRHWKLVENDGTIPFQRLPANVAKADSLGTAAYKDATEFATAVDEALIYQLMIGSNVVAEVTNYNSSVRSPQLRLLQLEDGQYKVVWAETNGLARTLADAKAYTDSASAELAGRKADKAWGKYTSGLGAEAPSNTTWVSTPVTVIAGGYEYAKVITSAGEAWVLCSNGMSAGPDTNAYFRVATLDGESLFSVERSESVLIAVRAGGITCSGNTVSIPLDVVSAEAPVCYACDDLVSQEWVNLAEELPSWVTAASASGSAGSWVWTIETTASKGFFQFRALQEGRTVIRNNAPAELTQGIWVNGSRYVPVANGSTLTWTLAQ